MYRYYYIKNVQGDVVQIRSSYGTLLVEYTYVLSITGSNASVLGANNPIRYRSYYYDFETGFYYLQSRYYDPAMRRFINADGYGSTGQGFIGYNMYAVSAFAQSGGALVSKLISFLPKDTTQYLTMGDIFSVVWNEPPVKTGVIKFFSGIASAILNNEGVD